MSQPSRREILAAIRDEQAARRAPVPVHLVAIAVNAATEAARSHVEAQLLALRQEKLVALRQNLRGSGLVLTDTGRVLLEQPDEIGSAKPTAQPAPALEQASEPEPQPDPEPEPEPQPGPDAIDWERHPELRALLCELGGLVAERLACAIDAGDLAEAHRLKGLATRVLEHTGGPRG